MEYSSNTSSSPFGNTGMTHLGFEISSSNFWSLASGKFSIRASASAATTPSDVSVDEIRRRCCCCGCEVGDMVGGGTVFGDGLVLLWFGEPPSSPSEREFGPETVMSVIVGKTDGDKK